MSSLGGMLISPSSFLFLFSLVVLIFNIFRKIWWIPTRVQKFMASQGIKGPPYRLIHGNTKEIANMYKEAMNKPLYLSHDILPVNMIPHMIAGAETMLRRWKNHEGQEIEMYQEFRLLTSEVISRTAFGSSYLEGKHIFEMLMKLCSLLVNYELKLKLPGIRLTALHSNTLYNSLVMRAAA
ncbi:putative secologanin synthase [Rosa chinensis]|uniref:Putative secologanin synthase n=1 Tax=Rosa chinensis TaxID=74649 RepID=A0A2P6RPU3_ROSCH|nr:putative secologanin synthase [Rosa chinensis]